MAKSLVSCFFDSRCICKSCTCTNPQQIEVIELERYVDRRVVNSVHRSTTRRPPQMWSTSSTIDEFFCWQHSRLAGEVRSVEQSSRRKYRYFGDTRISLKCSVEQVEGSLLVKNQLDPSRHFCRRRTS